MKNKHTFEFDVEESKTLYDLFVLDEEDAQQKELDVIATIEKLRDYKITIIVEEV